MPKLQRFLSRRRLLGFLAGLALVFGLLMLHPYPRQSLFGPRILGEPWCAWEDVVWRRVHREEYRQTFGFKARTWMGIEPDGRFERHIQIELTPLLVHLASHTDQKIREEATTSLFLITREHGDREGLFDEVAPLAKNADSGVRTSLMFIMAHFRKKSLPILMTALDDPDEDVRFQAVCQLGLAEGAKSAIPSLQRLLNDGSKDVRGLAARTLYELDPEQFPHLKPEVE